MRGTLINVPLPGGTGRVPGMLYAPTECAEVVGIVVVAPGSNGGTGPGIDRGRDGLSLSKSQSSAAAGSIYRRLGCELADAGTTYDWRGSPMDAAVMAAGGTVPPPFGTAPKVVADPGKSAQQHKAPAPSRPAGAIAMLHMNWRHCRNGKKWPTCKKMRLVSSLQTAANDIVASVNFMRATYGEDLPVVLVGFSFGGPAGWAAAGKLVAEGAPPAGVVALAGSARDGTAFQALGLDTLGCAKRCMQAGVSALLLHGTADHNVAIQVPQYFYRNLAALCGDTGGAVTLAVAVGAEHIFDLARDTVFAALKGWVLACICGPSGGIVSVAPCGPGAVALQLHTGGRAEPFPVSEVKRKTLLKPEIMGYSEKEAKPNGTVSVLPSQALQPLAADSTVEHSTDEESRASSKESVRYEHPFRPLSRSGSPDPNSYEVAC